MTYPKSCWGCGTDSLSRWTEADLATMTIDGEYVDVVCPDCHEELLRTGQVVYT